MKKSRKKVPYDVIVAGAGIGGVSAALAASRCGAATLLLESAPEVGGTGVHSPVGLVCTFFDKTGRPINRGIHEELFPELYEPDQWKLCQSYDESILKTRYEQALAGEEMLEVKTGAPVAKATRRGDRIESVTLTDGTIVSADWFIDGTADGNLAAMAGAEFQKGRASDGLLQSATLTFRVHDIDFRAFGFDPEDSSWRTWANIIKLWNQLDPYFQDLKASGRTSNSRKSVLAIPDPNNTSLLFNQTAALGVDPTDAESVRRGYVEAERQVSEFWEAVREHPAFRKSPPPVISTKLGVREGRRIIGDYILTVEDCLGEARFADMVAACGYHVDIHDPLGGNTRLEPIPGSGYYHIPYRCLTAKGLSNLLIGSRCISGTHEAHSSYRVMAPVSAIGQAAGTAAALSTHLQLKNCRDLNVEWIRHALQEAGQFVEGTVSEPSTPAGAIAS